MGNGYPYATETRGSVHASVTDRPTLKMEGECAKEWCPNWALKDKPFCWNHAYVVTFAKDNSLAGLRSMSLERAKQLVSMAANCMASPGRILDAHTGEEFKD